MQNPNLKYRADIDGLRAIAVATVVVFHAFPAYLPGGFIGVDIFFVISGYLISSILLKSLERGAFSFVGFYGRRIKRIFPALLLVLTACMVAGWFLLLPDEYSELGKHVAGGAGSVANLLLWDERGYFDVTSAKKPLLHLWSLGIEEQFYFVWPFVLWAAWKLRLNVLTVCIVLLVGSFLLNVSDIVADPISVFYLPHTRAWELLIGAVLAYAQLNFGEWLAPLSRLTDRTVGRLIFRETPATDGMLLRNMLSVCGAALLCVGFWTITPATQFPGYAALLPCLGAASLIAAGQRAWINRRILSSKPFVWLGLISYPLYLWHWPLLSFGQIINGRPLHRGVCAILVLVAILLAAVTYLVVERPLRSSRFRFKVRALGTAVACVGIFGFSAFHANGLPDRSMAAAAQAVNSQFVGPIWKYAHNDTCLARYPFPESKNYGWWFCAANQNAAPQIMIIGNSFANHLYPGMASEKAIGDKSILSIGTCGFDDPLTTDEKTPVTYNPCTGTRPYHQRQMIDQIVEKGTIKYAIIDGLNPRMEPAFIDRVAKGIDFLEKYGVKPIVFQPHLMTEGDLKGCFARPLKQPSKDCTISVTDRKKFEAEFQPLVDSLAKTHPEVKVFNQNDFMCDSKRCSFVVDGMPVFRDEYSHYSKFASDRVADLFVKWAKANEPGILAPITSPL